MGDLRISLFGKFRVQSSEGKLTGLDARKAQELLSYLLLYRRRPHPREVLASLLWGDNPTAQSKKYLRQALWEIQAALDGLGDGLSTRVLHVESDWVRINAAAEVWLDVAVFERACACCQGIPGEHLDGRCVESLRQALDLYRGDLLEDCYEDWCLFERERLQSLFLSLLEKLMGFCEAHQAYEEGLVYGQRILRRDRAHERTHWRLMRLHYLAGDRTAALRQYERCAAALAEELGVRPSKRTRALYELIRSDQMEGRAPTAQPGEQATSAPSAYGLDDLLPRLAELATTLNDVEGQLRREIQALNAALETRP